MKRLFLVLWWLGTLQVLAAPIGTLQTVLFQFREPNLRRYQVPIPPFEDAALRMSAQWLYARLADKPDQTVELGSRIVLTPAPGISVLTLIANRPLRLPTELHPGIWSLQAPDAYTAAEEAQALSAQPGVLACYPAMRRPWALQDLYAPTPSDPYFSQQWHLENRADSGPSKGLDVNVRAAWPITQGSNVTVAVVDDGVEMTHPDLVQRFAGGPHFSFLDNTTNAGPSTLSASHSTSVAGLIGATGNNQRGVIGVAPSVRMASWVIFLGNAFSLDSIAMKSMFEYRSNVVDIQNHSWGTGGTFFYALSVLEDIGISNSVTAGRGGRGVNLVRAASNYRASQGDANADGYAADPRAITVAAARSDGRAARYSNPGACVLVAGPSAESMPAGSPLDLSFPTLVTTDRTGSSGKNPFVTTTDSADYRFGSTGFDGTSGSTPIVSGVIALMLSANPQLTYRDVQQVLLLSSRHLDLADPMLQTNGAGLRVSYNLGYGIPDAGAAVARARSWINRTAAQKITKVSTSQKAVPDDGLRVEITGTAIPEPLVSIPSTGSQGAHADDPTEVLPIVSVGLVTGPIATDLSGKAVLCQRGVSSFSDKIQYCADAGARMVILYNSSGTTARIAMQGTDFARIPAVIIGKDSGDALERFIKTNNTARARINLQKVSWTFAITNTLICEHVQVRLQTDHSRRGDLRATLVSPSGTRSILQRVNTDPNPDPIDWTYSSVEHFFEPTFGNWRVEVSDQETGNTGSVLQVDLTLRGVAIVDSDGDGLDDRWEKDHFGTLSPRATEDPDGDGLSNAVEQVLQTDPLIANLPFRLDLAPWNNQIARVSWPGVEGTSYRVSGSSTPQGPYRVLETVTGKFPVTEWFTPLASATSLLIRIEQVSP